MSALPSHPDFDARPRVHRDRRDDAAVAKLMRMIAAHGDVQRLDAHRLVSVLVRLEDVRRFYPTFPYYADGSAAPDGIASRTLLELHNACATLGVRYGCHYSFRPDLLVTFPEPDRHGSMLIDASSAPATLPAGGVA